MYIETLITTLCTRCRLGKFDLTVAVSFEGQIFSGIGFTEKQAALALRILSRYKDQLSEVLGKDVSSYINSPVYQLPLRKSVLNLRSISVIDHSSYGRSIKVSFPYDESKITEIRRNKSDLGFSVWDPELKSWIFGLDERNIQFLMNFINGSGFEVDDEFKDYISQVTDVHKNIEKYVPMISIKDGTPLYVNQSKYVPPLTSVEIIPALFEARRAGITVWDEAVSEYLTDADPFVMSFLSNNARVLEIDSSRYSIHCLADLVKYTTPTLFVIPGGSEYEKTKMIYEFLISQGYKNSDISVMFRLPSANGKSFNDFVKDNKLNNPVTENTKFVLVSIKIPKPVIRSDIQFNSVISLGRSHVHYTMQVFLRSVQNLIVYCDLYTQKEINFGNL